MVFANDDGMDTDPPNAFGWCNCTASAMGTTVFKWQSRAFGLGTKLLCEGPAVLPIDYAFHL